MATDAFSSLSIHFFMLNSIDAFLFSSAVSFSRRMVCAVDLIHDQIKQGRSSLPSRKWEEPTCEFGKDQSVQ